MSQPVTPPGNPFAPGAMPPTPLAPPPAAVRANTGLAVATAVGTALVAALVYGGIAGAIEHEIGWAAIAVGFVIGFATGKVGGPNPILAAISAVLAVGAVYLGQLVDIAIIAGKNLNISATGIFFDHFSVLTKAWNEDLDIMTFLFLALAAFAAFSGAKKA
jgi:hypothetical protein